MERISFYLTLLCLIIKYIIVNTDNTDNNKNNNKQL